MELQEAFKTALQFEKKGHAIYNDTANKTGNPIVAKTFNYLAEQELFHIGEIEEYIENLGHGRKVELKGDNIKGVKKFLNATMQDFKEKTELSDDDIKAHETALELEKKAFDFYKKQLDTTEDKEAKKFFKFLMQQENAHYELIQKAYEYIKDPIGFYTEEEKWMADGG